MEMKEIALITGVGRESGVGFEVTRQLANLGFKVIVTARKKDALVHLAGLLKGEGLDVVPMVLDITDEQMVTETAAEVNREFGKLDVLINNATVFPDKIDTVAADLNEVRSIFEVNFFGAWSRSSTSHRF
jgi:NAD(P)-dependent dehydrogenase (short-subunit alcohol dehydrogenase family)